MRLELAIQDLKLSNQSQDPGAKEGHLEVLLDCSLLACVAGSLGRIWHLAVAVSLGGILLLGGLNNLLVLLLFAKFPVIRTPLNLLLLNLSLSDLLACLLGTSFGFASSLRGRWLFGEAGCRWYGVANVLFGIVSLVSLSILSYERYMTVLRKPSKSMTSSYSRSFLCIGGTWLYSLSWTLPPLFIWSSFGPQKPGESCSVTWFPKTASNFSYIICLFIFCLIFPLVALTYCYGRILQIIRKQASRFPVKAVQRREQRILFMVVTMVTCYFLCWVPYGIVVLITVFGKPGTVTPLISIVPSILAKASTIVNPILYVLLNKQFYRCFTVLMNCDPLPKHLEMTLHSKWSRTPNAESQEGPVHLLGIQRRLGSTKVRPNPLGRNSKDLPFRTPKTPSMSSSKYERPPHDSADQIHKN
nr:PREDICTED: pinopsin [Anolis carolinensis]|eukprot:XP_016853216.1 PREDICTED: pinopsin [Anolis carolinensis]